MVCLGLRARQLERLQEGFSRAAKVLNVPTVISFTDDGSSLGPDYSEMSHVEEEMIRCDELNI